MPSGKTPQKYVLWGKSTIKKVDGSYIDIESFNLFPVNKRVKDLKDTDIIGKKFGVGPFRYIYDKGTGSLKQSN